MFLNFPKEDYYQWDTGQVAQLTDDAANLTEVHMHNNRIGGPALVQPVIEGENGRYVEIPDVLFVKAGRIILWGVTSGVHGGCTQTEYDGINVLSRPKPTDYAPGKVETLYYKALLERIDELGEEWDQLIAEEVPRVEQAVEDAEAAKAAIEKSAVQAASAERAAANAAIATDAANQEARAAVAAANEAVDELEKKVANGDFDGKDGKSAYEIAVENGFEGSEEEWLASLAGASVWIMEITIPVSGWAAAEDDADYAYVIDVALQGTTDRHCPSVTIHPQSLSVAESAELYPVVQTIDGALRFRAKRIPTADMTATAVLSSQDSESGSSAAGDSSQPATEEEVDEMLDEVFSS